MKPPNLSVLLLTTGTQPLFKFSLESVLFQISHEDLLTVSINVAETTAAEGVRQIIRDLDVGGRVRILVTANKLSVYEHYRFAIERSQLSHFVIIHDDEIYNSSLVEEIRRGFHDPSVKAVVGGMLKVEPTGKKVSLALPYAFSETRIQNGLEWVKKEPELYPRFCFSAIALNKLDLDLNIFSADSTAADCIAVTQQAIKGNVYQSEVVFATWLQLPTRNSRWYIINPGLITPWKEFLAYFESIREPTLIRKALESRRKSIRVFLIMLFIVAIANRDPVQISTCLKKLAEVSPRLAGWLSPFRSRILFTLFSVPCRAARDIKAALKSMRFQKSPSDIDPCKCLQIQEEFWSAYKEAALKIAAQNRF